jgi:hypothetical protein
MALDLRYAHPVSPPAAPVSEVVPPISLIGPAVAPPQLPENTLEPLAEAGVVLTKWVLTIVSVVLVLLMAPLIYEEARFNEQTASSVRWSLGAQAVSGAETVEKLKIQQEVLTEYAAIRKTSREFWAQIAQMLLLNLLLPVLTALLGYVFASKSNK